MQTLYPNVPKYGEVPRGVSDAQMLASMEGRQVQQQPVMPLIGQQAPAQQPMARSGIGKGAVATDVNTGAYVDEQGIPTTPPMQGAASANSSPVPSLTDPNTGEPISYTPTVQADPNNGTGMSNQDAAIKGATSATSAAGAYAIPAAAAAAVYAYGANDAYNDIKSSDKETQNKGWTEAAVTAIAPTFEPVVSPVFDVFDTGKPEAQQQRDNVRKGLQKTGIMTENYEFELPNGQLYYAGKDGSTPEYQVQNPDRPLTGRVIGAAQVMAAIMVGQPGKAAEDLTGQLTNMALSNATTYEDAMNNLMHQFTKFVTSSGLTPQAARDEIASWVNEGLIDQQAAEAYLAAHNSFLEGNPWQFTNEAANAPLQEGQAAPPAATFQFDPAANLRPGASPGSSPMPTAPQSTGPTSTGPRPVTAPQAPRMAPARGAGPLPTQGPIKNLTPGTTPTAAASMTGTQRSIPPHIQEILLRGR